MTTESSTKKAEQSSTAVSRHHRGTAKSEALLLAALLID